MLIAASPTRGLDVAAVADVHSFLLKAAEGGTAVLLISEDLDEILALNDRVLVMYEGGLSEVETGETVDADRAPDGRRTPGARTEAVTASSTHDRNGAP